MKTLKDFIFWLLFYMAYRIAVSIIADVLYPKPKPKSFISFKVRL